MYTPISLKRETDPGGVETGRFTFENHHRLPPIPQRLRELGGNGPHGRRGAGATIKGWGNSLAEIQNAELRRAGETKRYDPRSYRDQGLKRVAGQHVGTKRGALDGSRAREPTLRGGATPGRRRTDEGSATHGVRDAGESAHFF